MKEICVVVGVKECMATPESFPFTDKHAAASVNKIHRGKKREWDTFDSHKGFFPLNKQRSNKICARGVPRSLKQRSINLEQILFLWQRYYFNFYAWMKKENAGGGGANDISVQKQKYSLSYVSRSFPAYKICGILAQIVTSHATWPCRSVWTKKKQTVLFQNEKAIFLGFIIFRNSQPFFLFNL